MPARSAGPGALDPLAGRLVWFAKNVDIVGTKTEFEQFDLGATGSNESACMGGRCKTEWQQQPPQTGNAGQRIQRA